MINKIELLELIKNALNVLDSLSIQFKMYGKETESYKSTFKVLSLLRKEVEQNSENINERILRAMHDIGMSSYKEFENTEMETAINNITSVLYNEIPHYKTLKPLRMDFGKEYPI